MTLSELSPAERHREVAAGFTARVEGLVDWDAPSPVAGWDARDVVAHLTTWLPGFLAGSAGVSLPTATGDPVADWRAQVAAVQSILDDPHTAGRVLTNPHTGDVPLADAVDRFYTADVFMHTWDLAVATGQDDRLDPGYCGVLYDGMRPIEQLLRDSGQYGPAVPVPDDAGAQERLLGFIGRDPHWSPHPD